MSTALKLSNLQLELLKIYSFDVRDEQLRDIKNILARYFANQASKEMDKVFEENGWGMEKIEEWADEHMRISSAK